VDTIVLQYTRVTTPAKANQPSHLPLPFTALQSHLILLPSDIGQRRSVRLINRLSYMLRTLDRVSVFHITIKVNGGELTYVKTKWIDIK